MRLYPKKPDIERYRYDDDLKKLTREGMACTILCGADRKRVQAARAAVRYWGKTRGFRVTANKIMCGVLVIRHKDREKRKK